MRVIAGKFRGSKLDAPEGATTRPITDRIKETLFNIIGARLALPGFVPEVDVLDLFAGTGGLGIEALSRGARTCLFVEHDRRGVRTLRENVSRLGLTCAGPTAVCRICTDNAWSMRFPSIAGGYGLVFLDPPYRAAADPAGQLRVIDLLNRIAPVLSPSGLLVFRHQSATRLPLETLRGLRCVDQRELGTMRLWFFSPPTPPPTGPVASDQPTGSDDGSEPPLGP
jgi:16S rRNA (guanine966-N2)-methyltransferase